MIERTQARFGLWPERLAADAGYGDAANLAWLVEEKGIKPHIPVFDKSARRDGTFERADFVYDPADDSYICPGGKRLRQRRKVYREPRPFVDENGLMRYRASKLACDVCGLTQHAGPQDPALDPRGRTRSRSRSGADRRRLRGPNGANDEFRLAATAQNLRKLAKLIPIPQPA